LGGGQQRFETVEACHALQLSPSLRCVRWVCHRAELTAGIACNDSHVRSPNDASANHRDIQRRHANVLKRL
jgi:hypothetical protein